VRFDAAVYGFASYTWNFGDGKTGVTKFPLALHRFAKPGFYVVTLTVADGTGAEGGSSIAVKVVAVVPWGAKLRPGPGPSATSRKDPAYSRAAARLAQSSRAVFCWSKRDWAILSPVFDPGRTGAFVQEARPREINLGPRTCARLDAMRYRAPQLAPTVSLGVALLKLASAVQTSVGEAPAVASCHALQQVPTLSELLGSGPAYARRLGSLLAAWYGPSTLPKGSWSRDCRDGGTLDLDPAHRHWP
jgi:hypothetical protein